jgi:hypothetical protein
MSAIEQLKRGDRITGPDETQWRVVDPDDRHDTVHLEADSGGDLWIDQDELHRQLAAGPYTHRSEADQ